ENGELAYTELTRSMRDRGAGAARAELDHAIELRIRQSTPEAFGKAGPVGVVAGEPTVADHYCIYGVQRTSIRREIVEQRDHRLLAGIGDVEAGETAVLRIREQPRQCFDADAELVEVDQLIAELQALRLRLVLMQRRRARLLDPGADQAEMQRHFAPSLRTIASTAVR